MLHQQIHNYKIISLLGEGGMANVYLAENQVLGNQVALKLLKEEYVQHPNIRKRFLAEARNLAKMNHPNVIKVTDLIDAGDIVAFVMEYIDGKTLEKYIEEKGKLSDPEIESFFDQMIASLEYIHSQGFIHRDIKPSNFMITKNNEIKLLDFGIAKNINDGAVDYTKTGLMQQMGTPLYMSPEQIKNTSEVTKRTDIYSLGVVLWQMVMGKKPYDTDVLSLPEIQVAILKEPLPLTNTIWDEVIQQHTSKLEQDRLLSKLMKNEKETKIDSIEQSEFSQKVKPFSLNKSVLFLAGLTIIIFSILFFKGSSENKLTKNEITVKSSNEVNKIADGEYKKKKNNKDENKPIDKLLQKQKENPVELNTEEKNEFDDKKSDFLGNTPIKEEVKIKKTDFDFIKVENLEVMTRDIGVMNWHEAIKKSKEIGNGWRLPTMNELGNILYEYKYKIGGFSGTFYWTSAISGDVAFAVRSENLEASGFKKETIYHVRFVRTIN